MDPLKHWWLIAALLLIPGAAYYVSRHSVQPPEIIYQDALARLRNGEYPAAALAAHQANTPRLPAEWSCRFLLVEAEAELESGQMDSFRRLLSPVDSNSPVECQARSRILKSRQLISVRNYEQANQLLGEAISIAKANARDDLKPEALNLIAQIIARQMRLEEAEDAFRQARDLSAAQKDSFREATAINGLAMIKILCSRCDEAIPLFEAARGRFASQNAGFAVHSADNNIALCYRNLGDFERALAERQALAKVIPPSSLAANNLGETGTVFLETQQPLAAVPYYRNAVQTARKYGTLTDAARWAGNLTLALAQAGQWDQALQEARSLGPEPRSLVFLDLANAEIALGRRDYEGARKLAEGVIAANPQNNNAIWQAYADIGRAWTAQGHTIEGDKAFEAAIAAIETGQSTLTEPAFKMTFLARLIQFYQEYVDLLVARGEIVKALRVADASRARLLSQSFLRSVTAKPSAKAVDFQNAARISGRVWLCYWLGPRKGYLWIVTPSEIRVVNIPGADTITPLVEEYRGFVASAMRDPMVNQSEAGRKLFDLLIAPAGAELTRDSAVMIVPDGALHQLGFDTLPVYAEGRPHYWMQDVNLAIAPSFGLFRAERQPSQKGPALLLGNPLSADAAYPTLKFAAQELEQVRGQLASRGVTLVTGAEAQPAAWRKLNPNQFSIIHIAAHAEANRASPMNSALILSPGSSGEMDFRLPVRDLMDVPIHADLVTLSACRSSGSRVYSGEGQVGLSWAFLHAGARTVVAGLWDVADESTSMLMAEMYAAIARGKPPATALREARLAMLSTRYAKPYYWGPFQCYVR